MKHLLLNALPSKFALLFILLPVVLSGCGGGGEGNSPSTNALTSSFTVSAQEGEIPFTVTVDGSASQNAQYLRWDFGDGTFAEGSTASHTYNERGFYTIQLSTSDQIIEDVDNLPEGTNQEFSAQIVRALGHSISGTITAPTTSLSDSDTNDSNASVSNNSFANAQLLPSLSIVGGHLNSTSDPSDFYRIDLVTNQRIELSISQFDSGLTIQPDLDLYLYNNTESLLDASLSISDTESLVISQSGSYFLEIRAEIGESNYLLSLVSNTNNTQNPSNTAFRLSSDFAIGQAISKDKGSQVDETDDGQAQTSALKTNKETSSQVRLLRKSFDSTSIPSGSHSEVQASSVSQLPLNEKLQTLKWIKELNQSGNFEYVEPNIYRAAFAAPNDQLYPLQWHYNNIQLPDALDIEGGNSNVIVAVIDSGVLSSHPDLSNQLVSGYDFVSDTESSLDDDGIDNDPRDPGDQSHTPNASSFHGTHVIGTVAAATNNSIGVSGVAGGVQVMPLRALGKNGFGTNYDIIQALRYAAGLSNDSGTVPTQPASIINLSLGSTAFSQSEQDLYNTLASNDILVIAAAGNSNSSIPEYPAAYNNVISVSATNISNTKAQYSNFGSTIDLAAPGGDLKTDLNGDGYFDGVLSTMGDDSSSTTQFTYGFAEGTSMAAPHVAGVAALMKSVNPSLSASDFFSLMQSGALSDDLGVSGRDDLYGYGLINAKKAVEAASGSSSVAANILLSNNALNYGSFSNSETITVTDSSNNTLTIDRITTSNNLVSVVPATVNPQGFGSYQISIDRSSLTDGNYEEEVVFNAGNLSRRLNLYFQVITEPISSDAGYLYILAINPEDNSTQGFTEMAVNNGEYHYEISDLNKGNYLIVAGTDMNSDLFICDKGDSCGAYPTLNAQEAINLQQSTGNIDFTVRFDNQVSTSSAFSSPKTHAHQTQSAQTQVPRLKN